VRLIAEELAKRHPALFIEPKPAALAVHYRAAPELAGPVHETLAQAVAAHPELKLIRGHAVSEIKPAWADKGRAVDRLLTTPAFLARTPVMIGDDVTDEDGFRAAMRAGGCAIKVGTGESLATSRLPDPGAVRAWLERALSELSAPGG
jgi:trehalose 6-phosphate phosphatase